MRFLVTVHIPAEAGNAFTRDPKFGDKIKEILTAHKAEVAYFTAHRGQRTCIYVTDMHEASKLPSVAEPWWLMAKADVELTPVMGAEDFAKAAPDIAAAVKKYS
jgi:hypothetical protein